MDIATTVLLLEAECPKPPKLPGTPTVNTASTSEIMRAVSSIVGRRTRLSKATEKLQKAEQKLQKKPTEKNEIDVACAKLGVQAAQAWLEFTTTRYQMLKDKLDQTGTASSKAKMAHIIAWGDPVSVDAVAHNMSVGDDDAPAPGAIPDFKYDFKKNKLITSSGEDYEVSQIGSQPSAPKVKPDEPDAPPVADPAVSADASPKTIADLSTMGKATLKADIAYGALSNLKATGTLGDLTAAFDKMGINYDADLVSDVLNGLQVKNQGAYAEKAKATIKDNPGMAPSGLINMLLSQVAVQDGALLDPDDAAFLFDQAKKSIQGEPKMWGALSVAEQMKVKATVKKVFIGAYTGAPLPAMIDGAKTELALNGLKVSTDALSIAAQQLGHLVLANHEGFEKLAPDVQQAAEAVAKKAIESGQDVIKAVKGAGIASLSAKAAQELQNKHGKKPDPVGFFTEIQKLYAAASITDLKLTPGALANHKHPSKWIGLLSHHHVMDQVDTMKTGTLKVQFDEVKKRWKGGADAKQMAFKTFDSLVDKGFPKGVMALQAKKAWYANSVAAGYAGFSLHKMTLGEHPKETAATYYDEWVASKKADGKADDVVEAPKEPTPAIGGEPIPAASTGWLPIPALSKGFAFTPDAGDLNYTYASKLSKYYGDLTPPQKKWVTGALQQGIETGAIPLKENGFPDLTSKGYKSWRTQARKDMKALWVGAGVTSVGYAMFDNRASGAANLWAKEKKAQAAATPAGPTLPATVPEDTKEVLALYTKLIGDHASALSDWHQTNLPDIATKIGDYGGSWKQVNQLKKGTATMLKAALGAAPTAPPAAPPTEPETMPEITATTPAALNPIGMSVEALTAHLTNFDPSPGSPEAPGLGSSSWKKGALGGIHTKKIAPCGADGTPKAKGDHLWMIKTGGDSSSRHLAYNEAWTVRMQQLLGLGNTKEVSIKEAGLKGAPSIVQLFKQQSDLSNGDNGNGFASTKPWKTSPTSPNANAVAKTFARYQAFHFLIDDRDDHAGNFVQDPGTGEITSVDHGQSFKFFHPGKTLYSELHDSTQSAQVAGGGLQGRLPATMMLEWGKGGDVALEGVLQDPAFLDMLDRIEAIPSDVYKAGLKRVAETNDKVFGGTGRKKLKAKAFMEAADERRKNMRQQVADCYATLAKERAWALKAKGDPRDLKEINQEILDSIGMDDFLGGGKTKPDPVAAEKKPVTADDFDESPGWDDAKLPESSRLPSVAALAKAGTTGYDIVASAMDVKNGQATFYQLGENPMLWCRLDREARNALASRLAGAGAGPQPPSPPASFDYQAFVPPSEPMFNESDENLHTAFASVAGVSENIKNPDGTPKGRVQKYIEKWDLGISKGDPGLHHVRSAWDWAKQKSVSADPLEAAAGKHYVDMLSKMGEPAEGNSWAFKAREEVPEENRKITAYVASDAEKQARKDAKADAKKAYEDAKISAKKDYDEGHDKAKVKHAEKEKVYKEKLDKFHKEQAGKNFIPAKKFDDWQVPSGTFYNNTDSDESTVSDGGGGKVHDAGSTWSGGYISNGKKPGQSPNARPCFEVDFTDAITKLGIVGGGSPKDRLLVHFQPEKPHGKQPGRDGAFRIQFPAGATKPQMTQMMQLVNERLGVDVRPASAKEQELNYMRQMAWHRHYEGANIGHARDMEDTALGANPTVQQRIDFWGGKFEEKSSTSPISGKAGGRGVGYDPRFKIKKTKMGKPSKKAGKIVYEMDSKGKRMPSPNYSPIAEDVGGGIKAFKRFDITADEILEITKGKSSASLSHGIQGGKKSVMTSLALMANNHRFNIGMNGVGMSLASDVQTGGSNTTYWYTKGEANSGGTIKLDPRIYQYTGVWSHPGDKFGATQSAVGGHSHKGRSSTVKEQERLLIEALTSFQGSGETLAWTRIDFLRWAKRIRVPSSMIDKVKQALKDQGITHIGPDNKPIDEVITT